MALVRPRRPLPGADGRVAQSAIIIALVLQHLPCQLLPKLNLGRRRPLAGACLSVVSVDLRLVDTRVLVRKRKKTKLKIVMFDSQVSLVNTSQGLEKTKKEHSRI